MGKPYQRDPAGYRLDFAGMNIVRSTDDMPPRKYPYAQNVRRYLQGRITGRATQDSSVCTPSSSPVYSVRRLNDSTPKGPSGGFILVSGSNASLYADTTEVATSLSGNPVSLVPFRPAASPEPWMYVGDSLQMLKVRSDGTTYAMGIEEPQVAPQVTATAATEVVGLAGPVTVYIWGDSPHSGPTGSYIWRNANDNAAPGLPVRDPNTAVAVATGSSLWFDDDIAGGYPGTGQNPVPWFQFASLLGTVNTSGTSVTWDSGSQFGQLSAGETMTINAVTYTIQTVNSNTSITLTTSAGTQSAVEYTATAALGPQPLFQPKLEAAGYQDFNCCVVANLYIPDTNPHTFTLYSKDECIWGIGGNASGSPSPSTPLSQFNQPGTGTSTMGQTKTVVNGLPLLDFTAPSGWESGQSESASVTLTFPAPGVYPIELDWDYWYHTGRGLRLQADGQDLYPITGAVIVQAQYRYTYRSSATGATSNPSPESPQQTIASIANSVVATPSTDPQVDSIDFYRMDLGAENFTYVGTGPNTSAPFSDSLLDSDISGNPLLDFDNYQPFPSIDLPQTGVVNVVSGSPYNVAQWVSGNKFNTRWLPGTIIIVGTVAYTLYNRPSSSTQLMAVSQQLINGVETTVPMAIGNNQPYQIAEPDLAAQPLKHIWGPTDNVAFAFGCGDPLRPGTLYWSKGNNLDSAPDTNQQDITSPSEPLMNGCITNGIGMVFSTERAFLAYPNFFNALATVQGTEGSTWTIQESISNRGLYMEWCLAVDGGGNVFFRAKDGIYVSPGGQGSKSITDEDLYNLFPHEGFKPQPVTRGGFVVYPPNDNNPQAQQMSVANGYLYYDYEDINGIRRTLVFDIIAGGWVVDAYGTPVAVHALEEGSGINGVLTGCTDGTIRPLVDSGAETATSVVLTRSETAGDERALKHWADLYIEGEIIS